jgi:serine protease Do
LNGKDVDNAHSLSRMVASTTPDTAITLQVIREGKPKEIKAAIGTMPADGSETAPAKKESSWGMTVQNLTPELAQRFDWDQNEYGVVISNIQQGSPAAEAKLRPGDLIKEINRQKIQNLKDYNQAIQKAKKGESLLLLVKRGERTFYVALKAPPEQ